MPRRDTYLTDDDDDTPRRAGASGGGVPGWAWVAVGGGVLVVLLVVGLGFFTFTRREGAMRAEAQRADMMRAEVQTRPRMAEAEHGLDGMAGPGRPLPVLSLARITNAYKNNRGAAETNYTNQQVRVRVEVKVTGVRGGQAWAGAAADLGDGPPPGAEPNVIFRLTDGPVAVGTTVVLVGRCDGLLADPRGGETLTFTECRVERE